MTLDSAESLATFPLVGVRHEPAGPHVTLVTSTSLVRVSRRTRLRAWWARRRLSPAALELGDAHAAELERSLVYGPGITIDLPKHVHLNRDPGDEHLEPAGRLLAELDKRYPRDAPHTLELRDACADVLDHPTFDLGGSRG